MRQRVSLRNTYTNFDFNLQVVASVVKVELLQVRKAYDKINNVISSQGAHRNCGLWRMKMYINGIDEIDNDIINLLLKDARMSYSDIGVQVGLSRTAVKNRIAVLEKNGIIGGYRAIINPQESTEMMTFIVNVETNPEHFDNAKQVFADAPETVTLIQTTGRNSHLTAICVSKDVKTMRDFVNHIYRTVNGILSINANSVLDVVKGSIIPE